MKTLVISGSIRSRTKNMTAVMQAVDQAADLSDYARLIERYQKDNTDICNSDLLCGAVLLAMKQQGAEVDSYSLIKLFPQHEGKVAYDLIPDQLDVMLEKVSKADGIVLVTPVYFGDRSSVANKFLQLSGMRDLLRDKVFGSVAVGAKRNGGQETTIIYCLMEALAQNAIAVGNGPPTSQYGGTAVGGHKGTVITDEWGLRTAFGTGTRVAHVGEIARQGALSSTKKKVRILVLVSMDNKKGLLLKFLEDLIKRAEPSLEDVEFKLHNVLDSTIYRCIGCDKCPNSGKQPLGEAPTEDEHAHCILEGKEDAIDEVHMELLKADGIIVAGLNINEHKNLVYRYQVMTERTRFIRRNNFELNNKVLTAFSLNQVGARINSLHSMKTITSYIRQNTIICKPIEALMHKGEVLEDGIYDLLAFTKSVKRIVRGREEVPSLLQEYTTKGIGGY